MHVGVWLPCAKTWAGSCATRTTLFSVAAIVEAEFFFDMKRFVVAFFVFVTNHFMRTRNHATSTTGAKARINNFFVELLPLICPALSSCRCCLGNGHGNTLRHGSLASETELLAQSANDLV